jgi:peroxiredoxin (alkyl hydroperoxide reductase subunit C)
MQLLATSVLCCMFADGAVQAWVNTPRAKGGLGGCSYPLLADLTKQVARDYDVLIEEGGDAGVALR